MNKRISDYVAQYETPGFFRVPEDEALEDIHTEIKSEIETATATLSFEIDRELLVRAEAWFGRIGWTLEEACVLFLYWFITCPDQVKAWMDVAPESQRE